TPTQNPPSWGEGGQGGWADRNTPIALSTSAWHTKIRAESGIGNKLLHQVSLDKVCNCAIMRPVD
ncbi:MAG TPA: hypothetical protein PLH19_00405, partial [Anaerolineae bacterium]|nr:hypothetical protein [Anaerolineae bacterium]